MRPLLSELVPALMIGVLIGLTGEPDDKLKTSLGFAALVLGEALGVRATPARAVDMSRCAKAAGRRCLG